MIGLGVGEALGSFINGLLQDKYGSRKAVIFNVVELLVAFSLLIWYTLNNNFNLWTAAAVNFAWGLQDSGVNNFIMCIAGFQFEDQLLPFSIMFFIQNMAVFSFVYMEALITS